MDLSIRLEQVEAQNSLAFALALSSIDRSWGTETLAVAGGQLVLCGPGLYVNRAIAAGITEPLRDADIELIIDRSAAVGVPASVEVTPATHSDSIAQLTSQRFVHDTTRDVTVLARSFDYMPDDLTREGIEVVSVADRSLAEWQETSARAWGHTTESAGRASDVFAAAAAEVDGDGMLIALDASDGRPLGVASMTIFEDVATLGGMSTLPAERGRGVQAALILHRLGLAKAAGCTLATSTTVVGGDSERNVRRFGFRGIHTKQQWVRQ